MTRGAWPQERLWALGVISGIGGVPDQRLGRDVDIPRPRHRPVSSPDTAKQLIVRPQPIEHGTPQQILDVAFDDAAVRQGEAKSSTLERHGVANTEHDRQMLAQRRDPTQRQSGSSQIPVRDP